MRAFKIERPDEAMRPAIQDKIDNLNKPKGSLGALEELAMQVCLIQQTLTPSLAHPCHLLLGGDHGIEREGVSVSPREVTWQQMINTMITTQKQMAGMSQRRCERLLDQTHLHSQFLQHAQ